MKMAGNVSQPFSFSAQSFFFRLDYFDAYIAQRLCPRTVNGCGCQDDARRNNSCRFGIQLPLALQAFLDFGSDARGDFDQDVLTVEDKDVELFPGNRPLFHFDFEGLLEQSRDGLSEYALVANAPARTKPVNGALQFLEPGAHLGFQCVEMLVYPNKMIIHLLKMLIHLLKALVYPVELCPRLDTKVAQFRHHGGNFFFAHQDL